MCWEVLDSWDSEHAFALDLLGDLGFSMPGFLKLHKENNVPPELCSEIALGSLLENGRGYLAKDMISLCPEMPPLLLLEAS